MCVFFPPAEKITLYIEIIFTAGTCHMRNNTIVKYSLWKSQKNKYIDKGEKKKVTIRVINSGVL